MTCIGICKLDLDSHRCIGCERCFTPDCEECNEAIKYKPA